MYLYFRIPYSTSEKYVKTDSEGCEIYLISRLGNKKTFVPKMYPIIEENEWEQISEDQFYSAISGVGFAYQETKTLSQNEF